MKKTLLSLLVASVAYAEKPEWVKVGESDEAIVFVAKNRITPLGNKRFKALVDFKYLEDNHHFATDKTVDCDKWSINGEVVGDKTLGEDVVALVCKRGSK